MTTEKVIQMIDEYLLEPNSIHKDWVEALQMCKKALVECEGLRAEIERYLHSIKLLERDVQTAKTENERLAREAEEWKNSYTELVERT